jgi:hypothetical protein
VSGGRRSSHSRGPRSRWRPRGAEHGTVELTDLVATETLSGTLGWGSPGPLTFRSPADGVVTVIGLASGFVADIVQDVEIVVSGDVLDEANTGPVVVLEGDVLVPPVATIGGVVGALAIGAVAGSTHDERGARVAHRGAADDVR